MNSCLQVSATAFLRKRLAPRSGANGQGRELQSWQASANTLFGGCVAIIVAAIGLALGTWLWEWWKQSHEKPEFRFRYLALDLPLRDDALKLLFDGRAPYVQQNEVLEKFALTAAKIPETVGLRRYPAADGYLSRLLPGENVQKDDVGKVGAETLWMYSILPQNRQLIARGELDDPIARQFAASNPDHDGLFYSTLDDSRHTCDSPSGVEHDFEEKVHPTTFVLITLDIENISPVPGRELSLLTKLYRSAGGLKVFATPGPDSDDIVTVDERSFPLGTLRQNEHILVPLLILIQKARHLMWAEQGAPALSKHLDRPIIAGTDGERGRPSQAFYRSQLKDALSDFYFLGPALRVEAVKSNTSSFAVRDLAFTDFTYAVLGWGGVGSCPTLAVLEQPGPSWSDRGHVLVGAIGKARERTETRELPRFAGDLAIREEEAETTYLDYAAVELSEGARSTICLPMMPAGQEAHHGRLTLRQGGELRIHCEMPSHATQAHMILTGYYETQDPR